MPCQISELEDSAEEKRQLITNFQEKSQVILLWICVFCINRRNPFHIMSPDRLHVTTSRKKGFCL